jgi:hypothetical protein
LGSSHLDERIVQVVAEQAVGRLEHVDAADIGRNRVQRVEDRDPLGRQVKIGRIEVLRQVLVQVVEEVALAGRLTESTGGPEKTPWPPELSVN